MYDVHVYDRDGERPSNLPWYCPAYEVSRKELETVNTENVQLYYTKLGINLGTIEKISKYYRPYRKNCELQVEEQGRIEFKKISKKDWLLG